MRFRQSLIALTYVLWIAALIYMGIRLHSIFSDTIRKINDIHRMIMIDSEPSWIPPAEFENSETLKTLRQWQEDKENTPNT